MSEQPVRIAVFRALFLGDLLCATPALRALRARFPQAEIALIGLPWAAEVVRQLGRYVDRLVEFPGYPGLTEVEVQPERTARFLAEQQAYGYDLAFQMHGDGSISNGFVAELKARVTIGYRRGADERLTISLPYRAGDHEVIRWLRLAELPIADRGLVTGLTSSTAVEFPVTANEKRRAEALLTDAGEGTRPLIGLHAGAKDPVRRWPAERFAALADRLADRYGARIVLTGSAGERQLTATVAQAMQTRALDLAGATDLGVFAALIARLDLLVSNDTGASHLAAASGTRSVILFGPSRPEQWAPLDHQRHRAVDAWALSGRESDPRTALHDLPVEPVLAECVSLLTNEGRPALDAGSLMAHAIGGWWPPAGGQ